MSNRNSNATEINPRHFAEDSPAKVAGQLATVIGQKIRCTAIVVNPSIVICSIRGTYFYFHIFDKDEKVPPKVLNHAQMVNLSGGVSILSDNFDSAINRFNEAYKMRFE